MEKSIEVGCIRRQGMVLEFSNMAFFSYAQSCVDEAFADASKPEGTIPRVFLFVA